MTGEGGRGTRFFRYLRKGANLPLNLAAGGFPQIRIDPTSMRARFPRVSMVRNAGQAVGSASEDVA